MKTLLVINSSVSGTNSVSRILVEHAVAEFARADPDARIIRRDVGEAPIPHLTAETLAGVRGTPQTEAELRTRRLSDELIAELRAADTIRKKAGSTTRGRGLARDARSCPFRPELRPEGRCRRSARRASVLAGVDISAEA